ncbi:bcl-2-modifying factor isoform X4 [Opisthocomus hoazin]|uniref:bcl-2-modifying factor isoform X4 n=1 Tax=Opisthocomus hoazin TaxID=30419 RepID=UPI003F53A498
MDRPSYLEEDYSSLDGLDDDVFHSDDFGLAGILSSRTRQLKHSARPLPVRMLCCLVESLKSPGDSSMGMLVTVYTSLQLALRWVRTSKRSLRKVSGKRVRRCRLHGSCSALPTSSTGSTYSGNDAEELEKVQRKARRMMKLPYEKQKNGLGLPSLKKTQIKGQQY